MVDYCWNNAMYFSWLIVDITCNCEVKNVFQHRNNCLQIERLILICNQVLIDCMQQKIIFNWMEFGHNLYNLVFSFFCWGRLYFFIFFFKFLFYFLTLQYCIGFAIYQNESATGIHVFPIPNPPPSLIQCFLFLG